MGLMLGDFVDDYTVRVLDVFAMPQSGTGVRCGCRGRDDAPRALVRAPTPPRAHAVWKLWTPCSSSRCWKC